MPHTIVKYFALLGTTNLSHGIKLYLSLIVVVIKILKIKKYIVSLIIALNLFLVSYIGRFSESE